MITDEIQNIARELLESGQVGCVIGYEVGPRGQTRPAFVSQPEEAGRLVWSQQCTHNLVTYLPGKLHPAAGHGGRAAEKPARVAVVAKPCDSRAINVLLGENRFGRDQVVVIGVACEGILEGAPDGRDEAPLQARCQGCAERVPVVADRLLGEPPEIAEVSDPLETEMRRLEEMTPAERMDFWLHEFDRCIRCYACRQACPMCSCPTCLYERDDSLWVGMGNGLNEKRAFHLGRAYHLAGRCVGCDECARVCPVGIPLGLLNRRMAHEIETLFGYRAGLAPVPSPITTVLGGEESTP